MIPLRDNIPSRTTPFINYAIIAVCGLVFLLQLNDPRGPEALVDRFALIPARVLNPDAEIRIPDQRLERTPFGVQRVTFERPVAVAAVPAWLTLLTCIFLHGGWLHILGNMWFLFIFGDNVEDRFGHAGFLLLYLGCGVAASVAHLASNPSSVEPTIGASGAIAGVMGAYFLLYPRAKVLTLIPIFIFPYIVVLPAPLFLGIWFLIQFFLGTFSSGHGGGVAWWAHIGGFLSGITVAWLLRGSGTLRPPVTTVRPRTHQVGYYRVRRHGDPWM